MRFVTRRRALSGAAVVVLLGAGAIVWMTHGGAAGIRYRTAAAVLGTVTQTVSLSGNLTPVGERDLNFGGAGQVTAVNAQAGQAVSAGQVLATLDATQLQNSLTIAQANLSAAEARLSLDAAGPTAQSMAAAQAQVSTATATLQNDQTAYTDTVAVNQQAVDAAQSQLQLDQAKDGCDATPPASTCTTQDQSAISQDNNALQAAISRGKQADDQAAGQVNMARVQLQNAQASLRALDAGSTSQQLQMDRSQVQVDVVSVSNADVALKGATLAAPSDGIVASVGIAQGDAVGSTGGVSSAGSSGASSSSASPAIVVITPGVFRVTGAVSDALVSNLAVGQKAQVLVAGSSEALTGSVTAIAEQAAVSSGVATFAVTVGLDGTDASLRSGTSASVNVIVNQVVHVLTVPTSAVHSTGAGTSVDVLVNGQAQTRAVQIGAADALRTQIISGISSGDQVIVATVSANVPTTSSGNGLFGGFGGGGGGGGRTRGGGAGGAGGTGG